MTEPEVSLIIAMNYLQSGKVCKDIMVSIDGAHIKTKNTIHFDISDFMKKHGYSKCDGKYNRWQGEYQKAGLSFKLIISSKPGIGDISITINDGKTLYIESKKFRNGSGREYPAMREAIGQLMTGCPDDSNIIPVVAVPYTEKSLTLANNWYENKRIRNAGIHFMLVHDDEKIDFI